MRIFTCLLFFVVCAYGDFTSLPIGLSPSGKNPIMALGPDKFVYVGTDGALYKIDPNAKSIVWQKKIFSGSGSMPTGICFDQKNNAVVVSLGPDVNGSVASNSWGIVTVPFDGSTTNSYPFPGGIGGGGCGSVNNQLYLSTTVGDTTTPTVQVSPLENIGAYNYVDGLTPSPVPYMLTTPDGTVLGASQIFKHSGGISTGSLILIKNNQVKEVPLNFTPRYRPVPSSDGASVYIWGWNYYTQQIPADQVVMGMGQFDTTTGNLLNWYPDLIASDLAFNNDPFMLYLLSGNYVSALDQKTFGKLYNKGFNNPDGPNNNLQLIVTRKQFADMLTILRNGQVIFWDVPRTPFIGGVVNSASYTSTVAPNSWFSIFGGSLSFQATFPDSKYQLQNPNSPFPAQLDTARASLKYPDGTVVYVPMSYTSASQINALMPANAPTNGTVSATIETQNIDGSWTPSNASKIQMASAAPGIFVPVNATQDNKLMTSTQGPATVSDYIVVYANSVGQVDHPVTTGAPGPFNPLARCVNNPVVTIGGVNAPVAFCGLTPGSVGLYQVNIQIPSGVPVGIQDLVISAGTASSQPYKILIQ